MNRDASRTVTLQRDPPILDTDVSPNEQAAPVRVSLSFVNSFGGQKLSFFSDGGDDAAPYTKSKYLSLFFLLGEGRWYE